MINNYNKYIQASDHYNAKKPVMKETKDNKPDSERSEESLDGQGLNLILRSLPMVEMTQVWGLLQIREREYNGLIII